MLSVSTCHVGDCVCVCVCVCVQVDSLSFESVRESCLTGVGSLQDRLKLFALRSANASEVERWSHAHARNAPWSSQTVGRSTYSTLKHTNNHNTIYTHTFLICFNVHFLHCPLLHLKHTQKQNRPILNRFIGYNDTKLSIILHTNTQTFPIYTCTC